MMIVIPNKQIAYFDVDDTLVMWDLNNFQRKKAQGRDIVKIIHNGIGYELGVHREHIKKMVEHKTRGHIVCVWSAGGSEWAHNVVRALHLTDLVDIVISKPDWFYDDLPSEGFMEEQRRIYLDYDGPPKNRKAEKELLGEADEQCMGCPE